jgi:phospholipase C
MTITARVPLFTAIALGAALAGCAGAHTIPQIKAAATFASDSTAASRYIKHVVVIVQENRTFDNLFYGFPGAHYAKYGSAHGKRIKLHSIGLIGPCLSNQWSEGIADYDGGRMDGFAQNHFACSRSGVVGDYVYSYVYHNEVAPYWTMAKTYVLADHMFPTMFGNSFTAHLDLIAATANLSPSTSEVDTPLAQPWGCDAPSGTKTSILDTSRNESIGGGPFPCFTQFRTLADTLDAKGVSWKYYAPSVSAFGGTIWSEFDAIANVRHGADWTRNVISPQTRAIYDARNGKLPSVSWVIPDAMDSDHPGFGQTGPSWVAAVVNAIGRSRDWKSTAIVVLWDDWGGWYDDMPPPQLDYRGLGIRVPCIVISPYAKAHYVSHTRYEFGSVVKLIEEVFGLSPLGPVRDGYTDARANSMLDVFNFRQKPRSFVPISAEKPASYFLTRPPSNWPPDDD